MADFLARLQIDLGAAMTCAGGLPLEDQELARQRLRARAWEAFERASADLMAEAMRAPDPTLVLARLPSLLRGLHIALAITDGPAGAPLSER
jgi:hypothetical protein